MFNNSITQYINSEIYIHYNLHVYYTQMWHLSLMSFWCLFVSKNDVKQYSEVTIPIVHKYQLKLIRCLWLRTIDKNQDWYINSTKNFSRIFSKFSRTKNHKSEADFHKNTAFIISLRLLALGKINLIIFCLEIWEFPWTTLAMFYLVKNLRAFALPKVAQFRFPGLSGPASDFKDFQAWKSTFSNSRTIQDFLDWYEVLRTQENLFLFGRGCQIQNFLSLFKTL